MRRPRCGVPDHPHTSRRQRNKRYALTGQKWRDKRISYRCAYLTSFSIMSSKMAVTERSELTWLLKRPTHVNGMLSECFFFLILCFHLHPPSFSPSLGLISCVPGYPEHITYPYITSTHLHLSVFISLWTYGKTLGCVIQPAARPCNVGLMQIRAIPRDSERIPAPAHFFSLPSLSLSSTLVLSASCSPTACLSNSNPASVPRIKLKQYLCISTVSW